MLHAPGPAGGAPAVGFPLQSQSSQASPVTGAVTISAPTVVAEAGLLGVQFKVDGYVLDAPDTTAPFQVLWSAASAADGEHTLTAEARYASGLVIESAPLTLTVINPTTSNRTLYVDAAAGSDSNDGLTPSTAWRTLAQANAAVVAGDTVLLRGTFTGQQLRPAASGTPAKPITFTSAPGQTAVLDGGLSGVAVALGARSYIVVDALRIQNVPGYAIHLDAGADHNVVRDCVIVDTATAPELWGNAIRISQSSDNLIERNEITNTGSESANASDGIKVFDGSHRNRIVANVMRNGGHSLIQIGDPGGAEASDNVVAGNTLSNPWTTPLVLHWTARRTLVEGNRISDAGFGSEADVLLARSGIQLAARDNVIRYNEIINNAGPGIRLLGFSSFDSIGNQIYNNVVWSNGTYGLWISERDGRSVADNLIANNIFFRYGVAREAYGVGIEHFHNETAWPVGSLNDNRILNNIFLRQPGAAGEPIAVRIRNAEQGGDLPFTLAEFEQTHAGAADNLEADPLFTDAAKGRFTLRAGSPAIDRGLRIPGVIYLGTAPDLGAFEFGGANGTTPPGAPSGLVVR